MKIITIVGARPQFVKAATISRILRSHSHLTEVLIHTGQHYDNNMSGTFFEELDLPQPDYHLGIGSGRHGTQTGRMLEAIEEVLLQEQPARVLVYGDTNSTLAGALAAAKLHIPVAHIEAGLRSFNRQMPEELNRILTDHLSDLLFVPTQTAVNNLQHEGILPANIHLVGDVMYDAVLYYSNHAEVRRQRLEQLGLKNKSYILATVHRAENTDDDSRLQAIFQGLMDLAKDIVVVLPLHPRTRQALERIKMLEESKNKLKLIEPVGYLEMLILEKYATVIATDSGGIQKEAFFHQVPCVTLRDETEWVELVELGWNRLVPPHHAPQIAEQIRLSMGTRGTSASPYGTGQAAADIVHILEASSG